MNNVYWSEHFGELFSDYMQLWADIDLFKIIVPYKTTAVHTCLLTVLSIQKLSVLVWDKHKIYDGLHIMLC